MRIRAAALVAFVAICACTAVRLEAVVIDDFENPIRSATLWQGWPWNGTGTHTFSDGHVTLDVTPPPGQGAFYNFLLSDRTWKIQEGRTLEFRADLLNSNDDGALAWFGFYLNDANRGYMLLVDKDSIAFIKRENPGQAFFLTNGVPIKVSNVKLVLSMTGTNSSVLIKFKILDNGNAGAVIFQGQYWDTPAPDPMHPGWGPDNPPASYLGLDGYFLMCLFRDPGLVDPEVTLPSGAKAQVVYDNAEVIEYFPPHLEITQATNGVDLNWLLPLEEHIVVAADQLSGPWCPCCRPHTQTADAFCLNLPCDSPEKYFKLIAGTQFTDDFSAVKPSWMAFWVGEGEEWLVTSGILRLRVFYTAPYSSAGFLLMPAGTNVITEDFALSADILNWAISANNRAQFSLLARGRFGGPPGVGGEGYMAGLRLNHGDIPGNLALFIWDGVTRWDGPNFDIGAIPPPYRVQFSGVGNPICQMRVRVLNLTTGELINEFEKTGTMFTAGMMGWYVVGRNDEPGRTYTITTDNCFMSGTK